MSRSQPPPTKIESSALIAELTAQLAQERRISQAFRDVGLALGGHDDLDGVLELILTKMRDILDADRATLYLVDEQAGELVSRISSGEIFGSIRLKVGQGIAGQVAKTGKTIRIKDAYEDKRFSGETDAQTGYHTRSILAAPLRNHVGRIIGVIQALNKRSGEPFTKDDESLLEALATQAAVTIDNSRLYLSAIAKNVQLVETKVQLEHRVRDMKLLLDLESAMARATSLDELVRAALVEAIRACDAAVGAMLLESDLGAWQTHFLFDDEPGKLRKSAASPGEGFIGSVLAFGAAATASEADLRTRRVGLRRGGTSFLPTSAVGVPFEGQDAGPSGAIALYNRRGEQGFGDEDVNLLRLIAANVSTAVQLHRSRTTQERAERLSTIGKLLSSVIHDLKTPMSVISGYVQMMENEPDAAQRKAYAELVQKQFEHVTQMQREVLEFARGEKTVLVRRVYVAPFLKGVEQAILPEATGHGVEVAVAAEDKGTARFDEAKVTRAIHNLVQNALDAMGHGGKLTLGSRRENGALVLSVGDTGPGIPKEVQRRLFESFVTSGKAGGTGLGLAAVKKIVDEHAGTIRVDSTPKGTTFHLVLPQA